MLTGIVLGAAASEAATYVVSTTAFSSFTRTNAMEAPSNDAPVEIAGDLAKISFKVLDIEKDILPQGFSENKYDLIISSLALSGAENIETTLANVRRLLKPGGYLLLIELTDPHVMSFGLVFGCLSGWLRDRNDDGGLSPSMSVAKWKYFLDRAGFSGIEICSEKLQHLNSPFTLMFTQAVDDHVRFLRDPLAQSTYSFPAQPLTLIGGKSAHTAGLIANIKEIVLPYFDTVKSYGSLSDLVPGCLPSMGAVLSLTELDEPVFGSITSTELKAFQELFKESKNIIWVGHGAQGSNPFANMFVGIQRTLVTEMDHLRVQFLNLESLAHAREIQIAQILLKFMAGDHLHPMIQANELLWYTEPELFLKDGQSYIPRLKMNRTRNNRYNSLRRLILKDVDRKEANVAIVSSNQGYQVTECALEPSPFVAQTQVQVTNALLRTVMIGQKYHFFLVTGREIHGGNYVVAFANSLKSCVSLDSSRLIYCTRGEDEAAVSMLKIYTHLLAQSAIRRVSPGKAIAVLDPDFSMLSALELYCSQKGVHLVLLTSKQSSNPSPWIYLHPQSTRRALRNKIPPHVTHFFDADGSRDTAAVILESLPEGCEIQSETSLTEGPSGHLPQSSFDELSSTFQASWAAVCEHDFPANSHRLPIHDIKSLVEGRIKSGSQAMISMRSEKLPVQVLPASKAVKFSIAKTYWLIGLTGGLGISICEWMARQGARYIVISSRNPSLDSRWLDVMNSRGCTIRVLST